MWGAKIYQNRQAILSASSKLFYETEHTMQYGYDQAMLNACIWPLAINDSVCTCTLHHPNVSTSQLHLIFNNDVFKITKIDCFVVGAR